MVWAKSGPFLPLRDHLEDVHNATKRLLTPARVAAFRRLGVEEHQTWDLVFTAAWLHDFGKATREWQEAIVAGRKPPQHSLTSFISCLWAYGVSNVNALPPEHLAVALAVLGHHGQLSKTSFQRETFHGQQVHIITDTWQELSHHLPFDVMRSRLPHSSEVEQFCNFVGDAKGRCPDDARKGRFRGLYCLLLAILIDADHDASAGQISSPPALGSPHVPGTYTEFQQEVRQRPADVLCAIAGCGSGKTAAALLRAAEHAERNMADRIVLCLPTRFTSNSLLRDMSDPEKYDYPTKDVGLIHGEALGVLRSLPPDTDDESDVPESPEEQAFRRIGIRYEHSVTISTVDHLLMSLYHGYKFSDRAFGNLMSSVVVFDEVHAYDTVTLNAIREGLDVLQRHNIPTLFMSATLPSSRRRFFGLTVERTIIEENNPFRPFVVRKLNSPLTTGKSTETCASELAGELLRESDGLKVAIYVNQVERAKALARAARHEVPGTRVYCYHSELAPYDRLRLEARIIRWFKNRRDLPVILIATQAAELSLDISADRMFTELAPADVLVQRAGRLHRRGHQPVCDKASSRLQIGFAYELLIAPLDMSEEKEGVVPGALPYKDISLLERTWELAPWDEVFDFQRGLLWCEEALTEQPITRDNGLIAASVNDTVFGNKPQENFGEDGDVCLVTIRERDEEPVSVIPEMYFGRLGHTLNEITPYLVPVRRHKYYAIENAGFIEERCVSLVLAKGVPNREKTIPYKVRVVRSTLRYDHKVVGFDIRLHQGEMEAQAHYDNILM